jgi:DNA-binding transcriptional ArsR family regulator
MVIQQGGVMKIISLLGAFAVLSLIIVPAFSQPSLKGCACMPGDCHGKPAENCCSKSSDNRISLSCTCPGQIASYSGMEYYDPGYSYFSKSSSRSPARPGLKGLTSSSNAGAFSSMFPVASNNVGPPDPDVVEYLPPSAKQVFLVLASDGPLTQKDIISKTDLPPRTVRYALGRLKGEEMLEERFCFSDARQSLYSLNGMDAR